MFETPATAPDAGDAAPTPPSPAAAAALLEKVQSEIRRVIVGQDRPVERLMVALLAKGHVLLEGVPGLAKTLAASTMAKTVTASFARIQFTPDLLPADVMGTRIFRASTEQFDIELGPVFVNFLLADEINRAPAKVQSALLEVMAERQVSIGGKTFPVPDPFIVLATQNPIESEGVYTLPEAQRDRFLMKIIVDYPTAGEEVDIVYRMGVKAPVAEPVISLDELISLQRAAEAVTVERAVVDYAVTLVLATRYPANYALADLDPLITFGGSPRASLSLVRAGRALALIRGRDHLTAQDVFDVAPDVLRHRMVLSYEALAQSITADQVLARVLSTVPAPRQGAGYARAAVADPAAAYRPGGAGFAGSPSYGGAAAAPYTGQMSPYGAAAAPSTPAATTGVYGAAPNPLGQQPAPRAQPVPQQAPPAQPAGQTPSPEPTGSPWAAGPAAAPFDPLAKPAADPLAPPASTLPADPRPGATPEPGVAANPYGSPAGSTDAGGPAGAPDPTGPSGPQG